MHAWIDISRPMNDAMICWPGRLPPQRTWDKQIAEGHHCNASHWQLSAHTGTHMDAPLHFCPDGNSIDQIPAEVFMGACAVVDLTDVHEERMDAALARRHAGAKRLLLRTRHSHPRRPGVYEPHDALLTPDAAVLLLERGLALVGTDRLTVDDSQGRDCTLHRLFLGAGCVIVEGLMLANVDPERYFLFAAPLPMTGGDASPIRALLHRSNPPYESGQDQEVST